MVERMNIADIETHLAGHDGILVLRPTQGDGTPEIAWGDLFFYYAPDGVVPPGQPFATVTTKPYPDEPGWKGTFRVNIHAGREAVQAASGDVGTPDTIAEHPAYARQGWISVVDPGPNTSRIVLEQLSAAYAAEHRRRNSRSTP